MSTVPRRQARHAPVGEPIQRSMCMPLISHVGNSSLQACLTLQLTGNSLTEIWNYCRSKENAPRNPLVPADTLMSSKEEIAIRLHWMRMEQWLRTRFRRLVQRWIFKRYCRKYLNTNDPATLSPPVKPVFLFDPSARGTYCFEASTLVKCIDADLGYSEWMFPTPHHPKNPLTNLDFTVAQRIKLMDALENWHMVTWKFQSYSSCKYKLLAFRDIFMTPLKLHALQDAIGSPDSEVCIDFLTEFMEDQYFYHQLHAPSTITILKWAIRHIPNHWMCANLRSAFERYTRYTYIYGEDYVYTNPLVGDRIFRSTNDVLTNVRGLAELRDRRIEWIQEHAPNQMHLPNPVPPILQIPAQIPAQIPIVEFNEPIIVTLNIFPEEEPEGNDADTED
jgi:hypothetical protein